MESTPHGVDRTRPELVEAVSRAAHACWCDRMIAEGWTRGDAFSAARREHDALVEFDRLGARDRRILARAVVADELPRRLARAVDHARGPDRELDAAEMRVGLRVGWALPVEGAGEVIGWSLAGDELEEVRVRWGDGLVTTHHPAGRELRRLDETGS